MRVRLIVFAVLVCVPTCFLAAAEHEVVPKPTSANLELLVERAKASYLNSAPKRLAIPDTEPRPRLLTVSSDLDGALSAEILYEGDVYVFRPSDVGRFVLPNWRLESLSETSINFSYQKNVEPLSLAFTQPAVVALPDLVSLTLNREGVATAYLQHLGKLENVSSSKTNQVVFDRWRVTSVSSDGVVLVRLGTGRTSRISFN